MSNLMTFDQVAERLTITRPSVYSLVRNDPSFPKPFHVLPGAPRFREEDVEAWLVAKQTDAAA